MEKGESKLSTRFTHGILLPDCGYDGSSCFQPLHLDLLMGGRTEPGSQHKSPSPLISFVKFFLLQYHKSKQKYYPLCRMHIHSNLCLLLIPTKFSSQSWGSLFRLLAGLDLLYLLEFNLECSSCVKGLVFRAILVRGHATFKPWGLWEVSKSLGSVSLKVALKPQPPLGSFNREVRDFTLSYVPNHTVLSHQGMGQPIMNSGTVG